MNKNFLFAIFAGLSLIIFTNSCSKSDNSKAQDLFAQAREQMNKGEYSQALVSLNELDSLYPRQFDIRKQARHLRPQIIEQQTLLQLSENDSLLAIEKWHGDSLAKSLRLVKNPIENYYVASEEPKDYSSHPGIYARMSPDANFSLTVVTNSQKANRIELGGVTSPALPFDDYRVFTQNGKNYNLTFLQAEIDSCMKQIQKNPHSTTLRLYNNERGVGEIKLPQSQIDNVLKVYENALSVQRIKLLTINRERLEKTLTLTRSQMARTHLDTIK